MRAVSEAPNYIPRAAEKGSAERREAGSTPGTARAQCLRSGSKKLALLIRRLNTTPPLAEPAAKAARAASSGALRQCHQYAWPALQRGAKTKAGNSRRRGRKHGRRVMLHDALVPWPFSLCARLVFARKTPCGVRKELERVVTDRFKLLRR
jgi:hypothetical protein